MRKGRADAAASARDAVVDVLAAAGAVEPVAVDQARGADGGIALQIAGMAVEALALVGKDLRAARGGVLVAGLVSAHQQELDHVTDLARLERRDLIALIGHRLAKARHVGKVPALGIAGADAVQDGALDLGDLALAVKPLLAGEAGHAPARVALHPIAMAGGAMLVIDRLRI